MGKRINLERNPSTRSTTRTRRARGAHARPVIAPETLESRVLLAATAYDASEAGAVPYGPSATPELSIALAAVTSASQAAQAMPTYTIGSIPGTVFAEGQPVQFFVRPPGGIVGSVTMQMTTRGYDPGVITTNAQGVQTHTHALPVVGDSIVLTFNPTTGEFGYTPDTGDRFDFAVTFSVPGRDGFGLPLTQVITVLPQTPLHEADLVSSSTSNLEPADSPDYRTVTVERVPRSRSFNSKNPAETLHVDITGKTIVFDPTIVNGLYKQFAYDPSRNADTDNLEQLTVFAERVIVRGAVRFPQTNVAIHARELVFDDVGGSTALLDTTPLDNVVAEAASSDGVRRGNDGTHGERAGDVAIHVGQITTPPGSTAPRFVLNGGNGQAAGQGFHGQAGNPMPVQAVGPNGTYQAVAEWVSSEWYYAGSFAGGWRVRVYNPIKQKWPQAPVLTLNSFPGHGTDAIHGGSPGNGGRGGDLHVPPHLTAMVWPLWTSRGGRAGMWAETKSGGVGGSPRDAYHYLWSAQGTSSAPVNNLNRAFKHRRSLDGNDWFGPRGFNAVPGEIVPLSVAADAVWIHPSVLRPMANYVKDAYLAGNIEFAREGSAELDSLLALAPPALTGEDPFAQLRAEVAVMKGRAASGLDYFGNPPGWTPMLSFAANLAAYKTEIDSALRIKFLAGLVDRAGTKGEAAVDALDRAITQMNGAISRAAADVAAQQDLLPNLQEQVIRITAMTEQFEQKLVLREAQLLEQAKDNLKPPVWKTVLRTLAVIAKVVPGPFQPALATIGTGLDAIANFADQPLESIKQIVGVAGAFGKNGTVLDETQKKFAKLSETLKLPGTPTRENLTAYAKDLAAYGREWGAALEEINQKLPAMSAPKSAIEAELNRLKAQDPSFGDLIAELGSLNAQKELFARDLGNAMHIIGESMTRISADQQSALAMTRAKIDTIGRLDRDAVEQVREMGRLADERLLRYQYYMAKSYEYETFKPYTGNFRLKALTERISNVLVGSGGLEWLDNPTLFQELKSLYEAELRALADLTFTEKNTTVSRREQTVIPFSLTRAELDRLDAEDQVTINLVNRGVFFASEDAVKLIELSATHIVTAPIDPSVQSARVKLTFEHGGTSLIETGGRTFSFRHVRGDPSEAVKPILVGTTNYDAARPERPPVPAEPDEAEIEVLRHFLGDKAPTTASAGVLYARPGAWADVTIRKETGVFVDLTDVEFLVEYSYEPAPANRAVLNVRSVDGLAPTVAVSADGAEASGRADGVGAFARSYSKGAVLQLAAQPTYGRLEFDKWVDEQGRAIGTGAKLSLNLDRDRSVRPVYVEPRIAGVYVRGRTWAGADADPASVTFKEYLESKALGDDVLGFRVDDLPANATLPWINLNQIVLRYNSPLTAGGLPAAAGIRLDGLLSDYAVTAVEQLDPQTVVLTLDRALGVQPAGAAATTRGDRVRLTVPGAGPAGSSYTTSLNILPGDADRSGVVLADDFSGVKKKFFKNTAGPVTGTDADYSPFHDIDGSGAILANDFSEVKKRFFNELPAPQPAAAAALFGNTLVLDPTTRGLTRPPRRSLLEETPPDVLS